MVAEKTAKNFRSYFFTALPHPVVFCDKMTRCWIQGVPTNEKAKKGTHPNRRYFTTIGSSAVKMVANSHRHAAYHNKHW